MIEWRFDCEKYIAYDYALAVMQERVGLIAQKKADQMVWCLEHPNIYTVGVSGEDKHLLNKQSTVPVIKTLRGGRHTYHGPGQRIIYAMLDLKRYSDPPDLRRYVRSLEQVLINTLRKLGIDSCVRDNLIGVWVEIGGKFYKIAFIGVRVSRWVTYHGMAININPDLSYYKDIISCGIDDCMFTSVDNLGVMVNMKDFDQLFVKEFDKVFACEAAH